MAKPAAQWLFLAAAIAGAAVLLGGAVVISLQRNGQAQDGPTSRRDEAWMRSIAFNGPRSYELLEQVCAIGPRPSGSEGMRRQQELLTKHFEELGGRVSLQPMRVRHPENGSAVEMNNLIVEWHPDRTERILLCAHYDTRPFPDRDKRNPRGTFIGANDGASGVAVLGELGRHMKDLPGKYGVDFVLFDGEEFVFDDERDSELYFIGSTHFAKLYAGEPPAHRYRWGVLLDMVGDAELQVYQEINSRRWPETRPLVDELWRVAREEGIREFIPRGRYELRDDHVPLRNIGGIPTCDIIDFDYPRPGADSYWHTEGDTADKCSPRSLANVAHVVLTWLKQAK